MSRPRAATSLHTNSRDFARLEFLQRREAHRLRHVAMQGARAELVPEQRLVAGYRRRACGCRKSARSARPPARISRRSASRLSCSATSASPSVMVVATTPRGRP